MAMAGMMACESKLSVRDTSRAIMKTRPKIRIIHLLAPEIIRTEPSNFRELVQRLTGKSAAGEGEEVRKETLPPPTMRRQMLEENKGRGVKQAEGEKMQEGWEMMKGEVVEDDQGTWTAHDHGDSSKLLGGLGDLDGFIEGFLEFPQESNLGSTSSCGDLFGDSITYL